MDQNLQRLNIVLIFFGYPDCHEEISPEETVGIFFAKVPISSFVMLEISQYPYLLFSLFLRNFARLRLSKSLYIFCWFFLIKLFFFKAKGCFFHQDGF